MTPTDPTRTSDPSEASPSSDLSASQARLRHGLTVAALSLLTLMLCYLILRELTSILQPLLIAVFLCYLFVPAHRWLVNHRMPSLLAHILIVGVVLLVSYSVANMTFRSISEMSKDLPSYVQGLEAATNRIALDAKTRMHDMLGDRDQEKSETNATTQAATGPAGSASQPAGSAVGTESDPNRFRIISSDRIIALGRSSVEAFVGLFTSALVVAVYLIFLLAEVAGLERRVQQAFGQERSGRIMAVARKINAAVTQYIAVKTFVSLVIAGATTAILTAFGVQFAVLWGILTFFANFVPYIGSLVAVALPILMSFVQFGTLGRPLTLLVLLTLAQMVIGYFVEPRMIGRRLGVSPLMILLSLAFWGFLWGIPGMILSAPLIVTVKIILENIEQTRPIARMMSTD